MNSALHVLDHSLPVQSGYATRSHAILTALLNAGYSVFALTGPKHGFCEHGREQIDSVVYSRSLIESDTSVHGVLGQLRTIRRTRREIRRAINAGDVTLIHAHSPCLNGVAAIGLGMPLIYEMRSSWEDAAVSEGATSEGSLRYRISRALETYVAKRAASVIVICEGLKLELVGRGVPAAKITVVPNALSGEMFELPDQASVDVVRARHGLEGTPVIGYFGSFFEWEGVDSLVRAMPRILDARPATRLLLAGSGRVERDIRTTVDELGLSKAVIFAGRVDASEVRAYYQAADVMVYPRISHRLTEMVTPLKPLEAMAQGTPVVASDIGGHRELIRDGETGFLYSPQETDALVERVLMVLEGNNNVREIVDRARRITETRHRWSAIVNRYQPVYASHGLGQH
jgi:PEP-CTERM/exosortase A-associated glycosyltransferase